MAVAICFQFGLFVICFPRYKVGLYFFLCSHILGTLSDVRVLRLPCTMAYGCGGMRATLRREVGSG